jgi:hypothetical protein
MFRQCYVLQVLLASQWVLMEYCQLAPGLQLSMQTEMTAWSLCSQRTATHLLNHQGVLLHLHLQRQQQQQVWA